jgi:hypothetical protein
MLVYVELSLAEVIFSLVKTPFYTKIIDLRSKIMILNQIMHDLDLYLI